MPAQVVPRRAGPRTDGGRESGRLSRLTADSGVQHVGGTRATHRAARQRPQGPPGTSCLLGSRPSLSFLHKYVLTGSYCALGCGGFDPTRAGGPARHPVIAASCPGRTRDLIPQRSRRLRGPAPKRSAGPPAGSAPPSPGPWAAQPAATTWTRWIHKHKHCATGLGCRVRNILRFPPLPGGGAPLATQCRCCGDRITSGNFCICLP